MIIEPVIGNRDIEGEPTLPVIALVPTNEENRSSNFVECKTELVSRFAQSSPAEAPSCSDDGYLRWCRLTVDPTSDLYPSAPEWRREELQHQVAPDALPRIRTLDETQLPSEILASGDNNTIIATRASRIPTLQ
jgi:hypothetical protein